MSVNNLSNKLFAKLVNNDVPTSAKILKKEVLEFVNVIDQIMREMP